MSYRSRFTASRTLGHLVVASAFTLLAGCSSSGGVSNEEVQVSCAAVGVGYHPDPSDCTRYFRCLLTGGQWYRYAYSCPAGSFYSPSAQRCVVASSCPSAGQPATGQLDPGLPERRQLVR
ncbi:chitin binding domain-containing protein [Pseudomonas sp. BIGb0427]|uniref:chitin binding peritrophin-A domain-containing protein n=1 Tax=Pseudomonas sp. BIGb0427 TaxID=2724470 RepID=UPI0018A7AB84|nr:chitin binding domain-containing protein [Pseudomonas sp. BIGb0427]